MVKRAIRLLAVGAWALALWPIAGSFGQSSEPTLDKYGWWNANQTLPADPTGGLLPTALEVPPPPGAPEDGLYVESAAGGTPLAISAVSYFTGGGVDATLTLNVAEGSTADGATLAACPAGVGWDAAQNGRWDRRPTYDPASCTFLGTPSGATVTFSIPASAHEPGSSYLSLAIVPADGSGTFATGFDPPTASSLTTTPAADGGGSSAPPFTPAPAFTPEPVTVGDPGFSVPPSGQFTTPASPAPAASGDEVAAPTSPPAAITPAAVAADENRTASVVAGVALALLGAGLWVLASRPQRAPRLLGSLSAGGESVPAPVTVVPSAPRGLGRFVRGRTAPPNPI